MDRREELKAKARDHERKEQPEHALEVYLNLVPETPAAGRGGLWTRIGDLQERIGAFSNAHESFSLAATAFADNGQANNAVAISRRILALEPLDAAAHLRLGEISLAQGYRDYARSGIGGYARLTAATDQPDAALEPLAAYLGRFPDDVEVWKGWEEQLHALGKESEVPPLLERLRESLAAGGHTDAAERIGRELARMVPVDGRGGAGESASPTASGEGPRADQGLPLLDNTVGGGEETGSIVFAPLEGLEPTGGESYPMEESDDEAAEDLPLLGNLPELTTDRADLTDLVPTSPLAGMERFEFGGGASRPDTSTEADIVDGSGWGRAEDVPPAEDDEFDDVLEEDDAVYGGEIPLLIPDSAPFETGFTPPKELAPAFDPARIAAELREHAGMDVEFSDAASHYDLGLAYKEMDRFDESLANLAMAIDGGHDPAAVLEVAAEILVRKGDFHLADDLLRKLPGVGEQPSPEHLGVHYWLARASEEAGRRDDARHALELVVSVDPGFRDASERLQNLV